MAAMNWLKRLMDRTHGGEGSRPRAQKIDGPSLQAMRQENPQLLLLDVRTPEEFRERHIPGSRLMPLYTLNARQLERTSLCAGG